MDLKSLIRYSRYIDAHTHSDLYEGRDKESMLAQVREYRILTLSSATDPRSSETAFAINDACPYILTAAGTHPWKAGIYGEEDIEKLAPLYKKALQISEIGLDAVWAPEEATAERQSLLLQRQLEAAVRLSKPVTLHTKGAEEEVISMLKQNMPPSVLIHWFTGSREELKTLRQMGCYFTIAPEILTQQKALQQLQELPLNRILPETDNPPTWPWLFDQKAEALQIENIYQKAAACLQMSSEELHSRFQENLTTFFFS